MKGNPNHLRNKSLFVTGCNTAYRAVDLLAITVVHATDRQTMVYSGIDDEELNKCYLHEV